MSNGYKVDPGALRLAGYVFEQQSQQVGAYSAKFVAAAALPDSAFGNLAESYKIANQFQDFFHHTVEDLKALKLSMANPAPPYGAAERLRGTADNYEAAERANTLPHTG